TRTLLSTLPLHDALPISTCARRSFDAATICIALVIFCVALVEAMRTRMSLRLAIVELCLPLLLGPIPSPACGGGSRKPTQSSWRSEEHTSELQSRENLVC